MPTTIDSAGITFNDATSLTSANIGTAQLVNGSVTAAKLGTNEQKQIAKAWVNFNGVLINSNQIGPVGTSLVVTAGSNQGTWNYPSGFTSAAIGVIYYLNIGGTNATLGGVNVSTVGIQINSIVSANQAIFTLLAGNAISSQTVNGNGASTGYASSASGIRSSYNVSSVTKNGTGDYTVNFTTPMADANYSASGVATWSDANSTGALFATSTNVFLTSSFRVFTFRSNNLFTHIDCTTVCVQVFGN